MGLIFAQLLRTVPCLISPTPFSCRVTFIEYQPPVPPRKKILCDPCSMDHGIFHTASQKTSGRSRSVCLSSSLRFHECPTRHFKESHRIKINKLRLNLQSLHTNNNNSGANKNHRNKRLSLCQNRSNSLPIGSQRKVSKQRFLLVSINQPLPELRTLCCTFDRI